MSINLKINLNFNKEVNGLLDKLVRIELKEPNKYYIGELSGFDVKTSALSIINAVDEKKNKFTKIIIHGDTWSKIFQMAPVFPMEELSEKIAKVFPTGQVKFQPDSNTISILNGKIIVDENGLQQGSGPTANRVYAIYEQFVQDIKK